MVSLRHSRANRALLTATMYARNLLPKRRRVIDESGDLVVSLTSYGDRLRRVHVTIESIAAGTLKPSRLLLWLTVDDYGRRPRAVKRLEKRGLEVRVCTDWRSHKKYYPYCFEYADDGRVLITADDDVLYPRSWLQHLNASIAQDPNRIWACRAKQIAVREGALALYNTWALVQGQSASIANCMTGVSGVAYPPSFQRVLRDAGEAFLEHCARADDLWIHLHAVRTNTRIAQVRPQPEEFPVQLQSQRTSLAMFNTLQGGNDEALAAAYLQSDVKRISDALSAN